MRNWNRTILGVLMGSFAVMMIAACATPTVQSGADGSETQAQREQRGVQPGTPGAMVQTPGGIGEESLTPEAARQQAIQQEALRQEALQQQMAAGEAGQMSGMGQVGDSPLSAPGDSGDTRASLGGLSPVSPGAAPNEERLRDGTLIAKAEPSEGAHSQAEHMRQEEAATAAAGLQDVYFGFDSWTLTEESKRMLGEAATWLKANPAQRLTIEGHCDERGTASYNLVLGDKRAKAVQNYLLSFGVAPKRLMTSSFGKEKPVCQDSTEGCYQKNRRAHFVIRKG